nr:uncharacterized protein LOC107429364 isoform X11 [Ziziphus jujuba var. spinosa]
MSSPATSSQCFLSPASFLTDDPLSHSLSVITSTRTIYTRSHCRRSNLCLICSIFIWWMKLERYVLYQCFSLSSLFGKEFWGKILMGMNNVLAFGSAEVYYGWALEILLIQVCRNLRIKVKFNQLSTCLKLTQ